MTRPSLLHAAAIAGALALVASFPVAFGEDGPGRVSVPVMRRAPAADAPALAELYQSVLAFEPGAWTAPHSHAGGSYNTVIRGAVTLRVGDAERTFGPGEGWADEPGVVHVAGNAGSDGAWLIASMVVEPGVPPSAFSASNDQEDAPPPPEPLAMTRALTALPTGPLDVVEQVIDLEPGARHEPAPVLGPRLFGVVEGSVTVEIDGAAHVVQAGHGWSEAAGVAYAYAAGDAGARLAATTLLPRDAAGR